MAKALNIMLLLCVECPLQYLGTLRIMFFRAYDPKTSWKNGIGSLVRAQSQK